MRRALLAWPVVMFLLPPTARAGTIQVAVRGRDFSLAHVTAFAATERVSVLFLPGDGGWRGFAITIANRMAAAGYDVYALDTRDYLEAFTGSGALSVHQIADDLETIAASIRRGHGTPVALVGWSEGAALAIAAAAEDPSAFAGVVVFGVPEQAALGWRLRDSLASLAGREPDEPQFEVAPLLSRFRSPLVMIQATHDPFTPVDRAQALFERAPGRKRLEFIEAHNHRFDGGTERFFAILLDGLQGLQRGGAAPPTPRGQAPSQP